MQIFDVRSERAGSRIRIQATGELDLASAHRLRTCVSDQVRGHTGEVELDLREVGFVDSTGVRLLLTFAADAERDGWTLTILASDPVRRVVDLLGLRDTLLAPHPRDGATAAREPLPHGR